MGYRKLGRTSSQRKALLRDLTTDLIFNEEIKTTEARAKEVRKFADKMITLGKKGTLQARRQAISFLRDVVVAKEDDNGEVVAQSAVQKLFDEIAPRYAERNGGYTQMYRTMPRRGDAAQMVILKLVD
ncbi:MAG: 50S ribosomal protein L17 [Firmicutes bacterium]|uniref:Large ribosomal subunit protein bL17 n=1 Tax=Candidatus Gallilactobacillus intestinavium TaxID=2840838 RepID=A0A9D9E4V2_9LACO|nr:50S ribosomal protein L17 [Candidatus Gallilactobacillus intestinavium]